MHVSSVLAAALAMRGGVSAEDETPTRSPTSSFAPTLSLSPSFAPTGVPLCEPQCEYDYHYTSERMNKKILARVYNFCWILCGMVVFSLGLSFLGHYIRHDRSHKMRVYYKCDGSDFDEDDDLDRLISEGLVEELSTRKLDRRQVAVALKTRLDAVAGFSKYIIGFASLIIAQKAETTQGHYLAFDQFNIEYAEGFIFFMLTFALFLSCSLVAGEIARQIGMGYICPVFVVVNWLLEVLNAFGVLTCGVLACHRWRGAALEPRHVRAGHLFCSRDTQVPEVSGLEPRGGGVLENR